jgi:hypothetical protein
MRREPTNAESRLWQRLRRNQLGVRFRSHVAIVRFTSTSIVLREGWLWRSTGVRTTLEAMQTRNVTAS